MKPEIATYHFLAHPYIAHMLDDVVIIIANLHLGGREGGCSDYAE